MNSVREAQIIASDPKVSVYVNASAGSGKTKVLVDRILRLLLAGVEFDNILCITFTNAAADEILIRVKEKIKSWYLSDKDFLVNEIKGIAYNFTQTQLELARTLYIKLLKAENFRIQTIHSFCLSTLRRNSNFKIREIINDSVRQKLLEESFIRAINTNDLSASLENLMDFFNLSKLFDYVVKINNYYINFYLNQRYKSSNLSNKIFRDFGFDASFDLNSFILNKISNFDHNKLFEIATAFELIKENDGRVMKNWLGLDLGSRKANFAEYAKVFLTNEYKPRSRINGLKQLSIEMQDALKLHQNEIHDLFHIIRSHDTALRNFHLMNFCLRVFEFYELLKTQRNFWDYDQLLIEVIKLLEDSEDKNYTMWKLDCAIDHILIDEAQDLSPPQWKIIKLISEEFFAGDGSKSIDRTIFIVGDKKQSIFGFQGADPDMFEEMESYYRNKSINALKAWATVNLDTSFRSGVQILELVDDVLSDGVVSYQMHKSFRKTPAFVEIWNIDSSYPEKGNLSNEREGDDELESDNEIKYRNLGYLIANKIKKWLEINKVITGSGKNFTLGDLMILFRKRGKAYKVVRDAILKAGITINDNMAIAIEGDQLVQDFLMLYKFSLNQSDDCNMINLLRSGFIGWREEDILNLALPRKKNSIWDMICINREYQTTKEMLFEIIKLSSASVFSFFFKVISNRYHKSVQDYIFCNEVLDIKFQNIKILLEAASKFDSAYSFLGKEQFIDWLRENDYCYDPQFGNNSVKLTTVHSAKGLESSIVILADGFESEETGNDQVFCIKDDIFCSFGMQYDDRKINELKDDYKKRKQKESARLLYVAMTRSRDELYIVDHGEVRKSNNWSKMISEKLKNKKQS
jgi:ATP-dependent helicase/nuclease subunit A